MSVKRNRWCHFAYLKCEIFRHLLFPVVVAPRDRPSFARNGKRENEIVTAPTIPGFSLLTFVLVDRSRKSRFGSTSQPHTCAHFHARSKPLSAFRVTTVLHSLRSSCDHHLFIWPTGWRFDGVVGYRICLTHRRSPVRTRVEPISFSPQCSLPFKVHSGCEAARRSTRPIYISRY